MNNLNPIYFISLKEHKQYGLCIISKYNIMKRIIYITVFLAAAVIFTGCDSFWNTSSHYVNFLNTDDFKYITSIYYKEMSDTQWSKDQTVTDIYPGEDQTLLLYEGIYEFEIIMEDESYSYTFYYEDISVYNDMTIEVFYDESKGDGIKVLKKPKNTEK